MTELLLSSITRYYKCLSYLPVQKKTVSHHQNSHRMPVTFAVACAPTFCLSVFWRKKISLDGVGIEKSVWRFSLARELAHLVIKAITNVMHNMSQTSSLAESSTVSFEVYFRELNWIDANVKRTSRYIAPSSGISWLKNPHYKIDSKDTIVMPSELRHSMSQRSRYVPSLKLTLCVPPRSAGPTVRNWTVFRVPYDCHWTPFSCSLFYYTVNSLRSLVN